MTLTKRIIPCLDIANGRVVKGLNFKSIKDAGDPVMQVMKMMIMMAHLMMMILKITMQTSAEMMTAIHVMIVQ